MSHIIAYDEVYSDIVVDPIETFIFWTINVENSLTEEKYGRNLIIRANQDGYNRKTLLNINLYKVCSLVYWFWNENYFMGYYKKSVINIKLLSIDFNGNNNTLIREFILEE